MYKGYERKLSGHLQLKNQTSALTLLFPRRKYFFTLDDCSGLLKFYRNKDDYSANLAPLGTMDLHRSNVKLMKNHESTLCLELINGQKYELAAESPTELFKWFSKMTTELEKTNEAIRHKRRTYSDAHQGSETTTASELSLLHGSDSEGGFSSTVSNNKHREGQWQQDHYLSSSSLKEWNHFNDVLCQMERSNGKKMKRFREESTEYKIVYLKCLLDSVRIHMNDSANSPEVTLPYGDIATQFSNESEAIIYMASALEQHMNEQSNVKNIVRWKAWLHSDIKTGIANTRELRALVREGIPSKYRSAVWTQLLQRMTQDVKKKHSSNYFHSLVCLFNSADANKIRQLQQVLFAFATHNPKIGYCQGMNFIAAVALLFVSAEDTFCSYLWEISTQDVVMDMACQGTTLYAGLLDGSLSLIQNSNWRGAEKVSCMEASSMGIWIAWSSSNVVELWDPIYFTCIHSIQIEETEEEVSDDILAKKY
ncbi:PH domain protein [Trichuris suis]|nr:PH domain protein [Trichuris suis]